MEDGVLQGSIYSTYRAAHILVVGTLGQVDIDVTYTYIVHT